VYQRLSDVGGWNVTYTGVGVVVYVEPVGYTGGIDNTAAYIAFLGDDVDQLYWSYITECVQGGFKAACVGGGYVADTRDTNRDNINAVILTDERSYPDGSHSDEGGVIEDPILDTLIQVAIGTVFFNLIPFAVAGSVEISQLATAQGRALFFTMVTPEEAEGYAVATGRETIGMKYTQAGVTAPDTGTPEYDTFWGEGSTEYAQNAKPDAAGNFYVLTPAKTLDGIPIKSRFLLNEYPELIKNPDVRAIIGIDPVTHAQTQLWPAP
jgi:hypothetical protein